MNEREVLAELVEAVADMLAWERQRDDRLPQISDAVAARIDRARTLLHETDDTTADADAGGFLGEPGGQ